MVGLENEKFQDLVLNHLARLTQEMTGVKTDINDLKSDVNSLKSDVNSLKSDVNSLKSDVKDLKESQQRMESRMDRLESKVDLIQTQTAELTELKTDTTGKLDQLIGDIEFIKHKEHLNEEELFKLKTNLQIVK
jgi:chromosome segregation ATPase